MQRQKARKPPGCWLNCASLSSLDTLTRNQLLDTTLQAMSAVQPDQSLRDAVAAYVGWPVEVFVRMPDEHRGIVVPLYDLSASAALTLRTWDENSARDIVAEALRSNSWQAAHYFTSESGLPLPAWQRGMEKAFEEAAVGEIVLARGRILFAQQNAKPLGGIALIGFYRQSGPPHVTELRITDIDSGERRYSAAWQNGNTRTLQVDVNHSLVPDRNYRLYVAFSKPMRYQSATATPTAYPGQQTGPTSGAIQLQFPALDAASDVVMDMSAIRWLDQPDGVNDGFQRYVDDAATVEFQIPSTLTLTGSEASVLSMSFADMSDFNLDADPETVVDWRNGGWTGFEDQFAATGDVGGIDCNMRPFVAPAEDAVIPADTADCRESVAVVLPPPPAPAPAPPNRGGGNALWLLLLLSLLAHRSIASRVSWRADTS